MLCPVRDHGARTHHSLVVESFGKATKCAIFKKQSMIVNMTVLSPDRDKLVTKSSLI